MHPLLVGLSFSFFRTMEKQDINWVDVLILNNRDSRQDTEKLIYGQLHTFTAILRIKYQMQTKYQK